MLIMMGLSELWAWDYSPICPVVNMPLSTGINKASK